MKTTKTSDAKRAQRLTTKGRNGRKPIQAWGWKRLARLYHAAKPGSAVRKVISAEARRCGYTPSTILALNA